MTKPTKTVENGEELGVPCPATPTRSVAIATPHGVVSATGVASGRPAEPLGDALDGNDGSGSGGARASSVHQLVMDAFSPSHSPRPRFGGWAGVQQTRENRSARAREVLTGLREKVVEQDEVGPALPGYVIASREMHEERVREVERVMGIVHEDAHEVREDTQSAAFDELRPALQHHASGKEVRLEVELRSQQLKGLSAVSATISAERFTEDERLGMSKAKRFEFGESEPTKPEGEVDTGNTIRMLRCSVPWCNNKTQVLLKRSDASLLAEIASDCAEAQAWDAYWCAIDELVPPTQRVCQGCVNAHKSLGFPPTPIKGATKSA